MNKKAQAGIALVALISAAFILVVYFLILEVPLKSAFEITNGCEKGEIASCMSSVQCIGTGGTEVRVLSKYCKEGNKNTCCSGGTGGSSVRGKLAYSLYMDGNDKPITSDIQIKKGDTKTFTLTIYDPITSTCGRTFLHPDGTNRIIDNSRVVFPCKSPPEFKFIATDEYEIGQVIDLDIVQLKEGSTRENFNIIGENDKIKITII